MLSSLDFMDVKFFGYFDFKFFAVQFFKCFIYFFDILNVKIIFWYRYL